MSAHGKRADAPASGRSSGVMGADAPAGERASGAADAKAPASASTLHSAPTSVSASVPMPAPRCAPAVEEPLAHVAYAYDGTVEGLLTAVFLAYRNHEDPQDVAPDDRLQPRLGQSVRTVQTDPALARRVRGGLTRACGKAVWETAFHAALSDAPDAGTVVYRFIREAMKRAADAEARAPRIAATGATRACAGTSAVHASTCSADDRERTVKCSGAPNRERTDGEAAMPARTSASAARPRPATRSERRVHGILDDLAHPIVGAAVALDRAVMNERHRMQQFVRFSHLENDVWFARCNPNANVVPLLMNWFADRFNTQAFILYDEVHDVAGVYDGSDWCLVATDDVQLPGLAADERLMQAAWRRFYDTVSIEARYHPELRRQFMPKRLWKNILEVQDERPHAGLAAHDRLSRSADAQERHAAPATIPALSRTTTAE